MSALAGRLAPVAFLAFAETMLDEARASRASRAQVMQVLADALVAAIAAARSVRRQFGLAPPLSGGVFCGRDSPVSGAAQGAATCAFGALFGRRTACRLAGVAMLLFLLANAAPAFADRSMSTRFSTNDTGNITFAANTLMVCPATTPPQPAPGCTAARNTPAVASGSNAGLNNNGYLMQYVNTAPGTVSGQGASFDSSSATLSLPATATVLFAGLYWGGRHQRGTESKRRRGAEPR